MGGGGSTVESLSQRIPVFAQEYRVLAYDNRGYGRSDAPDIPYRMEMFADDLAELLDAIDIDSAHVSGESFGGEIAQYFALRYPERVRSLILTSTYCGRVHGIRSAEADKFETDRAKMTPEERARTQIRLFMTQEFAYKNPHIMQRMMEHPAPTLPKGAIRQIQAEMAADTYECLPQIKASTLIIHGEADNALPVENARILASRIPNAELVILKGVGHLLIEAGEEPNRIMLDFLKRHSKTEKK